MRGYACTEERTCIWYAACVAAAGGMRRVPKHSGAARTRCDFGGEDVGAVVDVARADENTLGELRDLLVEEKHDAWHRLNECHLGAERSVDVREFEADVTGADDGNVIRHPLQLQ